MAISKWNEENLIDKIEGNKKNYNNILNNWDALIESNIKYGCKEEEAVSRLKSFMGFDADCVAQSYALLGKGKEAREWFKISAQKSLDSMSSDFFGDSKSFVMLKSAVLSCDGELAKVAASKMLEAGIRQQSTLDLIKRMCELYAAIILNKDITEEYLAEMEVREKKYHKRISGMQPGAVRCCRGIIEKDKRIFIDGLSTMLPFTRRFYGQDKSVPAASNEAMLIRLAFSAGIKIGPMDFSRYHDLLPDCLFELDSNFLKNEAEVMAENVKWTNAQLRRSIEIYKKRIQESEKYWNFYVEGCMRQKKEIGKKERALSQYYWGIDPEYLGRAYALLGDGKEAKKWLEISAKNRYESMQVLGFFGIRSLRMLWNAVLSGNKELIKNIALKIKASSVNIDYGSDLAREKCSLYADIILGNNIPKEYLAELGVIEHNQNQLSSGMLPGAVESCQAIINKDKKLLISSISIMLQSNVYFFNQVVVDVPVAMEEAMLVILARNAGIGIGIEDFPKHKEILSSCLFG